MKRGADIRGGALAPTALFVLLWSSGGVVSRWALEHASPSGILIARFAIALAALVGVAAWRTRLPPRAAFSARAIAAGLLLIGGYSNAYFLALHQGLTPGVLAAILGLQPLITLLAEERKVESTRAGGLVLAFVGLVLVVAEGSPFARAPAIGYVWALLSLASITLGAIVQKRSALDPHDVLPSQLGASLVLTLAVAPFAPLRADFSAGFFVPVLWLALVISVGSQLLFYHLMKRGNLVDVTSIFYFVPVGTALFDMAIYGASLSLAGWLGVGCILVGLALARWRRLAPR